LKPINMQTHKPKHKEEAWNLPNRNPTELNTHWQTNGCSNDVRICV
jgi:hypothetical protein